MTTPDFQFWTQIIYWIVLAIGGAIAAFKAFREMRNNRKQRRRELRWKKANAAKKLLDEMFSHEEAKNAWLMLDWGECAREYEIKKDCKHMISNNDVISALKKERKSELGDKEILIRDCFDYFFYFIDRIEHYIKIKLISFEDVKAPLKRYAKEIEKHPEFEQFMKSQGYNLAVKFFDRFKDKQVTTGETVSAGSTE